VRSDYSGRARKLNLAGVSFVLVLMLLLVIDLLALRFDYEQEHEHDEHLLFPLARLTVSAPPATPREDSL
jgi:hypothetical protein